MHAPTWSPKLLQPFPDGIDSDDILLRRLTENDIDQSYLSWFDDMEVTKFLEARHLRREDAINFMRTGEATGTYRVYALIDKASGRHIGNVKLGPLVRESGVSDLVTVVGDRQYWGKGIARKAIKLGNQLAFELVGLRKLSGAIYADNIGSIRAYTGAGWVIEAVLHDHLARNGKVMDRVLVSCFNPVYFPELPNFPKTLPTV